MYAFLHATYALATGSCSIGYSVEQLPIQFWQFAALDDVASKNLEVQQAQAMVSTPGPKLCSKRQAAYTKDNYKSCTGQKSLDAGCCNGVEEVVWGCVKKSPFEMLLRFAGNAF